MINTYHFLNGIPTQDKTYILFARHGESEINALKRVGGASPAADLSLTEKGEEEARQLGEALSPFSNQIRTAYTSPLQRAHQTALIALKAMGRLSTYSSKSMRGSKRSSWGKHSTDNQRKFTTNSLP